MPHIRVQQSFEPLYSLLQIITDSVKSLESSFNDAHLRFPSLSRPYDAANGEQLLLNSDDVHCATVRITAACEQMIASVRTPMQTICDAAMAYNLPACLSVMERANVVEILRKAGPRGIHVVDIALESPGEIDPGVLSRILRLLATHHFLNEVAPDRFTNNRISSFLDTGKDVESLSKNPELKYDDSNGVAAFVGVCTDDIFKASAYLSDSLGVALKTPVLSASPSSIQNPLELAIETTFNPIWQNLSLQHVPIDRSSKTYQWRPHSHARTLCRMIRSSPADMRSSDVDVSYSTKDSAYENGLSVTDCRPPTPNDQHSQRTAFNLAFNTSETYFNWLEKPEQAALLRRFGVAMRGSAEWEMGGVVKGFTWAKLAPGSIVIDVGGGFGSACKALMATFPHLRFVVQDTPSVIELASEIYKKSKVGNKPKGMLTFESHDFFTRQTSSSPPAVFLLRAICHDWPDDHVIRILSILRKSAKSETVLVLGDHIMPYACVDDEPYEGIPGAFTRLTSETQEGTLLPNLGRGSANAYWLDLCMQVMFSSQERTLKHTIALTRRAGWHVIRVNRIGQSLFGYVVCKPMEHGSGCTCQHRSSL